jgi:hypothetical protein
MGRNDPPIMFDCDLSPFGPFYPALGKTVEKLRQTGDSQAHGKAVLEAIRELQRKELQGRRKRRRGVKTEKTGDSQEYGKAVLQAIRKRQRKELQGRSGKLPLSSPAWPRSSSKALPNHPAQTWRSAND